MNPIRGGRGISGRGILNCRPDFAFGKMDNFWTMRFLIVKWSIFESRVCNPTRHFTARILIRKPRIWEGFYEFCEKSRFWPIFWDLRKWPNLGGSISFMWCPFRLKFLWGLYLALKSSHINFQLKRTTHGGAAASPKSRFWASKGIPCDFWPFFERPPKRHF